MPSARITPPAKAHRLRAAVWLAACLACAPAASADENTMTVLLDRAQLIVYPPSTETVIVGNPIIADVTMLRNTGQMILTGKGFGETNLLFLDGGGKVLSEARIRVRESSGLLIVQRGMDRESYACHPRCEPTVALGDSSQFLQRTSGDIQARNAQASGAAAAAAASGH